MYKRLPPPTAEVDLCHEQTSFEHWSNPIVWGSGGTRWNLTADLTGGIKKMVKSGQTFVGSNRVKLQPTKSKQWFWSHYSGRAWIRCNLLRRCITYTCILLAAVQIPDGNETMDPGVYFLQVYLKENGDPNRASGFSTDAVLVSQTNSKRSPYHCGTLPSANSGWLSQDKWIRSPMRECCTITRQ